MAVLVAAPAELEIIELTDPQLLSLMPLLVADV